MAKKQTEDVTAAVVESVEAPAAAAVAVVVTTEDGKEETGTLVQTTRLGGAVVKLAGRRFHARKGAWRKV